MRTRVSRCAKQPMREVLPVGRPAPEGWRREAILAGNVGLHGRWGRGIRVALLIAGIVGLAGCVVAPAYPVRVWVPGYWAPAPVGHVWIEGHWRVR
jgi:hypothetical protein